MGFKKDAEIKTFLSDEKKTARYTVDDVVRDTEEEKTDKDGEKENVPD